MAFWRTAFAKIDDTTIINHEIDKLARFVTKIFANIFTHNASQITVTVKAFRNTFHTAKWIALNVSEQDLNCDLSQFENEWLAPPTFTLPRIVSSLRSR